MEARSRATSGCPDGDHHGRRGRRSRPGTTLMVLNGAANRDPRRFDDPSSSTSTARTPASTWPSAAASTPAPAGRWPVPRRGSASSGSSTARRTSASPRAHHGPAGARRYQYVPTYILRGLTRLHLEFTPVESELPASP